MERVDAMSINLFDMYVLKDTDTGLYYLTSNKYSKRPSRFRNQKDMKAVIFKIGRDKMYGLLANDKTVYRSIMSLPQKDRVAATVNLVPENLCIYTIDAGELVYVSTAKEFYTS